MCEPLGPAECWSIGSKSAALGSDKYLCLRNAFVCVSKMLLKSGSASLCRQDVPYRVQSIEVPIWSRAYSLFSRSPFSRFIPAQDCATGVVGNPCSTSTHVGDTQQRVAQTSAKSNLKIFSRPNLRCISHPTQCVCVCVRVCMCADRTAALSMRLMIECFDLSEFPIFPATQVLDQS